MLKISALLIAAATALNPALAWAQDAALTGPETAGDALNSGDNGWVLICSALVLLLVMPGLAMFYGGQLRAKSMLSVMVQVGAVAAVVSILWVAAGYRLAFGDPTNGWIGTGNMWMLNNTIDLLHGDVAISERTFALEQLAGAALATALMVGAWAERARFGWC